MATAISTDVVQIQGAGPTPVDRHHLRRWWILGVLGLAQLMVVLDTTS